MWFKKTDFVQHRFYYCLVSLRIKFLTLLVGIPSVCLGLFLYFAISTFVNDKKISLLENILLELSKNETLSETAKKKILSLISRVDYMKIAKDGINKYGKNIVDIISTGGVGTAIELSSSLSQLCRLHVTQSASKSV